MLHHSQHLFLLLIIVKYCWIEAATATTDDTSICPIPSPPVILVISLNDPYPEAGEPPNIKPNISEITDSITPIDDNPSCCLAYFDGDIIFMCSDLQPSLNGLSVYDNISSLSLYIGNDGEQYTTTLTAIYEIELVREVHIYGYGNTTVNINNSTLSFSDAIEVTIHHVSFVNGGIVFRNCFNVVLDNVLIQNSTGSPGCLIIWNNPILVNTTDVVFKLVQCSFIDNGGPAVIAGGALHVLIQENFIPVTMSIINCTFGNNYAKMGGAVAINTRSLPINKQCSNLVPLIFVSNSLFANNYASLDGGAIHLEGSLGALYGFGAYECVFQENTADCAGGALYISLQNDEITCEASPFVEFYDCNWIDNSAKLSAAMDLQNSLPFLSNLTIYNGNFTRNRASRFSYSGFTYCIVFCSGMNATLINTSIINNNGSGFCTERSKLSIGGTVEFSRNIGYKGGGVFLDTNSWMAMEKDSVAIFTANRAVLGGGIYQTTGESETISGGVCFLVQHPNSTIRFHNNNAYNSGDDLYLDTPQATCKRELKDLHIPTSKVSSSVYSIELNAATDRIILGQRLVLSAFVIDYFGKPTSTAVNVYLLPREGNLFSEIPYNLMGFTSFTFNNGSNNPEMYISGPDNSTGEGAYDLVLSSARGFSQIEKTVSLTIIGCPLGFKYVSSTGTCVCASTNLQCNLNTGTACVREAYWHGRIKGIDNTVTAPCVSGNCVNINNCTVCPSKGLTTFCLLPINESSECSDAWSGPLCTECIHGYSYTFLAKQCVKSSTCSGAAALIPTILILTYLVVVIVVIFLILKLGYHTQSGYIYCIVYYFSIVELLLPKNVAGGGPLKITISVFQSVLQLNSYFLGFIPVCVSPDITIIEQGLLLYLNPLIISIAILGIVLLSKRCSKFMHINDNSVPKAISLLILLSFTTLAQTSFNILIPVKYDSSDSSVYVKLQPSTKYLDPTQHLPWWIISILIFSFFIIPFTLLLLFAPLLVRCMNLTKIKPFLDEFQSCFKDSYRWMAGYYFLCRIIIFVSITISVSQNIAFEYIAMILSLFILIIHMAIQPYRNKVLNIMDSLLLADLVFLSLLYTTSSEIASEEISNYGAVIRQLLTYILVFLPMLYTITIAVIAIVRKLPMQIKQRALEIYEQGKSKTLGVVLNKLDYHVNDVMETPLIESNDYTNEGQQSTLINESIHDFSSYREPLIDSEGSVGAGHNFTKSVISILHKNN